MEETVFRSDAYDVTNVVFGAGVVDGYAKQRVVTRNGDGSGGKSSGAWVKTNTCVGGHASGTSTGSSVPANARRVVRAESRDVSGCCVRVENVSSNAAVDRGAKSVVGAWLRTRKNGVAWRVAKAFVRAQPADRRSAKNESM